MSSMSASVSSDGGRVMPRPTLLTQTSMRPVRASVVVDHALRRRRGGSRRPRPWSRPRAAAGGDRVPGRRHAGRPAPPSRPVAGQLLGQRRADAAARARDHHDRGPSSASVSVLPPIGPASMSPSQRRRHCCATVGAHDPLSPSPLSRQRRDRGGGSSTRLTVLLVVVAAVKIAGACALVATHLGVPDAARHPADRAASRTSWCSAARRRSWRGPDATIGAPCTSACSSCWSRCRSPTA